MSMENSFGNRTCDFQVYSSVPQETASPRVPFQRINGMSKVRLIRPHNRVSDNSTEANFGV